MWASSDCSLYLQNSCFQSFCLKVYQQEQFYLLMEMLDEKHLFLDDLENSVVET